MVIPGAMSIADSRVVDWPTNHTNHNNKKGLILVFCSLGKRIWNVPLHEVKAHIFWEGYKIHELHLILQIKPNKLQHP